MALRGAGRDMSKYVPPHLRQNQPQQPAVVPKAEVPELQPQPQPQRPAAVSPPPVEQLPPRTPVEVNLTVVLKIIQHSKEQFPAPVSGKLLGIAGINFEVSDALALSQKPTARERAEGKEETHALAGSNCVGFYESNSVFSRRDAEFLGTLARAQAVTPNSVGLTFDAEAAALGRNYSGLGFRAYRLTDQFLGMHQQAPRIGSRAYMELKAARIFVEVPIVVTASLAAQAGLLLWAADDPAVCTANRSALVMNEPGALASSLDAVSDNLDELLNEEERLSKYQKDVSRQITAYRQAVESRRLENNTRKLSSAAESLPEIDAEVFRVEAPSPLPVLLASRQAASVSSEMDKLLSDAFVKGFVLQNAATRP